KLPYVNGKYLVGLGCVLAVVVMDMYGHDGRAESKTSGTKEVSLHKSLVVVFWGTWLVLSILSFKHSFSLLPVTGILVNLYLMSELGTSNWLIFVVWLLIGLGIYFMYGYKHSRLRV